MMKISIKTCLQILFSLFCHYAMALQMPHTSAFVDAGGEAGQAFLVQHSGACHAIVPTHVVKDNTFISLIGKGVNTPMAEAISSTSFGYDISVMQIQGELAEMCGPSFNSISRDIKALLSKNTQAQTNTINPDGTVSRIPLTIIDQSLTHIFVKPSYAKEQLMKGMSGSLISVSGMPLGLLLSVDSETGIGKVIRIDRTLETINPYFRVSHINHSPPKKESDLAEKNLAEKVIKWTIPAIDQAHRASNLLSELPTNASWIGKPKRFPVQLVIDLKGDDAIKINTVSLNGQSLSGQKQLAKQVEIFVDRNGSNRWNSIGSITLPANGQTVSKTFATKLAKRVMLNIYNNWGARNRVGLSRVYITGP